ncbi:hypothetical protein GF345_00275 [Candidatus Woesearchaeota archaeon]|nr:hypothetical protein [Candidatus Woesearchaeota archaeon]
MYQKLDLSDVSWSKNDIKNAIKLPTHLTEDLSHFLGIHYGDGYMKVQKRSKRIDYRLIYSGHSINEQDWYENYISHLIKRLFNKDVVPRKTVKNTIRIYFCSKAIIEFLNKACEVPYSPKINIKIPSIVLESEEFCIKSAFLRGLADTDFSLVFKGKCKKYSNHKPTIDHKTSDIRLHEDIKKLLSDLDFNFCSGRTKNFRKGKAHDSYYIQINGKENLKKWMKNIGFSSSNHLTKYEVWKKYGFLVPKTDIHRRKSLLKIFEP